MKYAQYTKVPVSQSKGEIERMLTKYGADQFGTIMDSSTGVAMIGFRYNKRMLRFELSLASLDEQEIRQRWRALVLAIKAKLEIVECGITPFEEEFMAHIVMPNGQTFGKVAVPQIQRAIDSGKMPSTLMITHESQPERT